MSTMLSNPLFVCVRMARWYVRTSSPVSFLARRFIRRSRSIAARSMRVCVDIGAGTAPYRETVTRAFGVEQYVAVDIAPTDRTSVVADGCALPLKTGSVDMVVCFEVVQHMAEPEKVLEEVARVLSPGGCLILTFPFLYAECDFRDYRRWTMDGIHRLLERCGFEPLYAERRGGALFALACGLNWAMQHIVPGQRGSWREKRTWAGVMRGAAVLLLTVPTNVVAWSALLLDSLVRTRGAYIGGTVLAKKAP